MACSSIDDSSGIDANVDILHSARCSTEAPLLPFQHVHSQHYTNDYCLLVL